MRPHDTARPTLLLVVVVLALALLAVVGPMVWPAPPGDGYRSDGVPRLDPGSNP